MKSVRVTVVSEGDEALQAIQEIAETVVFTLHANTRKFMIEKTIVPVIHVSRTVDAHEGILNAMRVLALRNPLVYMHLMLEKDSNTQRS